MSDATDGAILGVRHAPPGFGVPAGACDCHTHVFGPAERFPYAPGRGYTPGDASVEQLLALQSALGLSRVVIVQPSPYGADNRCTLDALRRLGGRARGVAVIDDGTSEAALRDMHAAGVRGVRLNLESAGQRDPAAARVALERTAARVAPLGWHVQVYAALPVIAALREALLALLALPVPVVVDHYGLAAAADGADQPGLDALCELLRSGQAYVKLSAPHRISRRPDCADAAPIARRLASANPERVLWGSDWPHPGGQHDTRRDPAAVEPFSPVDDGTALRRLRDWLDDPALLHAVLVSNPATLYAF